MLAAPGTRRSPPEEATESGAPRKLATDCSTLIVCWTVPHPMRGRCWKIPMESQSPPSPSWGRAWDWAASPATSAEVRRAPLEARQ